MKYTTDAIKIPGTKEKIKEIELPDGAIPLDVETWLERDRGEGISEVLRGWYADQVLYYNDKEKLFNEDRSEMTLIDNDNNQIVYKTFMLVRYLFPIAI